MHFTAKIRGENPLEQQTAEAIMLRRDNGRSARLAPADPQPLTCHVDHPLDIDSSAPDGECPMFRGVGCKLVRRHAECQRMLGRQHRRRARKGHIRPAVVVIRRQFVEQHGFQGDARPARLRQARMGLREGPYACIEGTVCCFGVRIGRECLPCDRPDDRQRVLHAVAELGDEEIALRFGLLRSVMSMQTPVKRLLGPLRGESCPKASIHRIVPSGS